jgi:hypothetical protein
VNRFLPYSIQADNHRTITAFDGQYAPLASSTGWLKNPGQAKIARAYIRLAIRGTTGLSDSPSIVVRPYTRAGGTSGVVGALREVYLIRPLLYDNTAIKFQKTTDNGSSYTDYSANVVDNSAATYASIGGLNTKANGNWIVIGGPVPFIGFAADMTANVNTNAATLAGEYYNGTAWANLTNLLDATTSSGATFGKDGPVTWSLPSDWAASTMGSITAYWARFSVSAALSATVQVEECDLIQVLSEAVDIDVHGQDLFVSIERYVGGTGTVVPEGSVKVVWL